MEIAGALLVIILILGLLALGIYVLVSGIIWGEIFEICAGIFIILCVLIPSGCLIYDQERTSQCSQQFQYVNAQVINKEHRLPYTTIISTGKTVIPIYHAEEYNIRFKYNDVETTIDNHQLYDQVKLDDKIKLSLVIYRYKNGAIYKQELTLK